MSESTRATFHEIPIGKIRYSTVQPRRHIDPAKQAELVASISAKGIETPIGVRPVHDGLFEIVRGERRFRAAETLKLDVVPCMVRAMTDLEALESALVENTQRLDMNVMDEAGGYADLQKGDKRVYTVAAISTRTGQPVSRVYRLLKLMTLEKSFQQALREDRLTLGHAEKLLRLTPEQRADAMTEGVIWRESPLFRGSGKWVPTKDDLQPLSQLDWFIQRKAAFDPNAEDLQHFLPDVAAARESAIDDALADRDDIEDVDGGPAPTLLRLSDDSLVRVKLNLEQNDKTLPLSPSKWKSVKPGSCEHAQLGAIVHGGPARVLTVCIKRSCAKHWPQAKKKASTKKAATSASTEPKEASWERDARLRREAEAEWKPIWPRVKEAFIEHLEKAKPKLTAAFFRAIFNDSTDLSEYSVRAVEDEFGIKFTDKTLALVFALATATSVSTRKDFLEVAKLWKFNLGPTEQALKRELAEKAKSAKKGQAA